MSTVVLQLAEQEHPFAVTPDQSVLEGAIAAGVPLGYTCKAGRCQQCKVKVLDGAAQLAPPTAPELARLGHDKLKRQWRLACQARVLRGTVRLTPPWQP